MDLKDQDINRLEKQKEEQETKKTTELKEKIESLTFELEHSKQKNKDANIEINTK